MLASHTDLSCGHADNADFVQISQIFITENEISYQIRGAIFDVYNEFGPGLLEKLYKRY